MESLNHPRQVFILLELWYNKYVLSVFKKKKKQEESPAASGNDSFQAAELSHSEAPVRPQAEPSVKEVSKYKNELLLRGKIGMSTGSSAPEKPKKEEKPPEKPTEDPHADKIDSERAQVMKINLNKKLDEGE